MATPVPQPDIPGNGTAVIVETGQSAAIVNGNYTIAGVPTRHAPGTSLNPHATVASRPSG